VDPGKLSWGHGKSNCQNLSRIETGSEKNWQNGQSWNARKLQVLQFLSVAVAFFTTDPLRNPNHLGFIEQTVEKTAIRQNFSRLAQHLHLLLFIS